MSESKSGVGNDRGAGGCCGRCSRTAPARSETELQPRDEEAFMGACRAPDDRQDP